MSTQATDATLTAQLAPFDTATLFEAQGQTGMVDPNIRPMYPGCKLVGRVLTVECVPGDNLALHQAVTLAQPGDILLATINNDTSKGAWGEVLTVAAQARGIAGLAIDGAVRDIEAISQLGFPIFARGRAIGACSKTRPGIINKPINFGGLRVEPGDIIMGDIDGLVILKQAQLENTLQAAHKRLEVEKRIMEGLRNGQTTLELLNLPAPARG